MEWFALITVLVSPCDFMAALVGTFWVLTFGGFKLPKFTCTESDQADITSDRTEHQHNSQDLQAAARELQELAQHNDLDAAAVSKLRVKLRPRASLLPGTCAAHVEGR